MTTELQSLVVRIWQRAYMDSHEQAASQIEGYCQKQNDAISKDRDYYKKRAEELKLYLIKNKSRILHCAGQSRVNEFDALILKSKLSSHE